MASSLSEQYLLSTFTPSTSHGPGTASKSSTSTPDSAPSPPQLSARQQEKQPEAPPVPHSVATPQAILDRDVEAQLQPTTRPRTLAANYPIRELDGCCRTILMLHFEFAVYAEAIEAGEKNKKFERMVDLNHAIDSLTVILLKIQMDENQNFSSPLRLTKHLLHVILRIGKERLNTQRERKIYVRQLLEDLHYVKRKLEMRELMYQGLSKAIYWTLSDESARDLNYDPSGKQPLLLDDALSARIVCRVQRPGQRPMEEVRVRWQQHMLNLARYTYDDLCVMWHACVKEYVSPEKEDPRLRSDPDKFNSSYKYSHGCSRARGSRRSPSSASIYDVDQTSWLSRLIARHDYVPVTDRPPRTAEVPAASRPYYEFPSVPACNYGDSRLGTSTAPRSPLNLEPGSHPLPTSPPPARPPQPNGFNLTLRVLLTLRDALTWLRRLSFYIDKCNDSFWTFLVPLKLEEDEVPDTFLVVGWLSGSWHEPRETCMLVNDRDRFLSELRKKIIMVRGWRAILSFKTVQGFGLYNCHPTEGGHDVSEISSAEKVALSRFYGAVHRPFFHCSPRYSPQDSRDWAEWVHHSFNESQKYPFCSELSLQLIIKWSRTRLLIASIIPLLLSFAVGVYFMSVHEGVEGASAAWTIASYIVTAGAFIIALLAVLSSLKDG